jgi:hypothetical protein
MSKPTKPPPFAAENKHANKLFVGTTFHTSNPMLKICPWYICQPWKLRIINSITTHQRLAFYKETIKQSYIYATEDIIPFGEKISYDGTENQAIVFSGGAEISYTLRLNQLER